MKTQYGEDFLRWTEETASALRQHRFDGLDWEHIAGEIESLGTSERRALENRLTVLLQHLLKWQHQPGHRSNGWRATILEQRLRIDRLLNEMRSLRPQLDGDIAENYWWRVWRPAARRAFRRRRFRWSALIRIERFWIATFCRGIKTGG